VIALKGIISLRKRSGDDRAVSQRNRDQRDIADVSGGRRQAQCWKRKEDAVPDGTGRFIGEVMLIAGPTEEEEEEEEEVGIEMGRVSHQSFESARRKRQMRM